MSQAVHCPRGLQRNEAGSPSLLILNFGFYGKRGGADLVFAA